MAVTALKKLYHAQPTFVKALGAKLPVRDIKMPNRGTRKIPLRTAFFNVIKMVENNIMGIPK
jgi:hypothetical protein